MSEPVAVERRDDALATIVGTGDTRAMLATLERNVRDVIAIARDRGFVSRFGGSKHEFFGFPAWSLLALTYGLVPFVEWTKPVDGGWEARAIVRTRDGDVVSSAEAMCTRSEANRRSSDDHTLRAMAQTRAMRNALRACLGAALVMAGFDFADPEGPATNEQVGLLHQLERELGWSHDEGHAKAGVDSFKDLNREDASTLIDRWQALRDDQGGGAATSPTSTDADATDSRPVPADFGGGGGSSSLSAASSGSVEESPAEEAFGEGAEPAGDSSPSSQAPATAEAWERAARAGITAAKAKAIAKGLGFTVKSAADLTGEQLAKIVARVKDSA